MKRLIDRVNTKNGLLIPVIVFLGAILTPTPVTRAVYSDSLASTISTLYGLIMLASLFIYGIIIGKGFKDEKDERTEKK